MQVVIITHQLTLTYISLYISYVNRYKVGALATYTKFDIKGNGIINQYSYIKLYRVAYKSNSRLDIWFSLVYPLRLVSLTIRISSGYIPEFIRCLKRYLIRSEKGEAFNTA